MEGRRGLHGGNLCQRGVSHAGWALEDEEQSGEVGS